MPAIDWTYDSDVGVYKNNKLSGNLLTVSAGATKIIRFTDKVEDFGKGMGETINIMHVNRLPHLTTAQLNEQTRIPIAKISFANRALTIVPWGQGCEYTDMVRDLGRFNIRNIVQRALTDHMTESLDTAAAKAFMDPTSVLVCMIPTGASSAVFDTDGTPSTVATSNLTWDHIGILSDYLAGNLHVPPYEGEDYVMISCRKTLRGLKSDNVIQAIHLYLQKGDLFYKGELGKMENIRAVQVDREDAISNTAGTSTVLGDAFAFGDEAVSRAEVEMPHLRADPNYSSDFGRVQAVAWYGKFVLGSTWNVADDGKAKIVRITSA
jgi:N4-gp56 family major capsid protein